MDNWSETLVNESLFHRNDNTRKESSFLWSMNSNLTFQRRDPRRIWNRFLRGISSGYRVLCPVRWNFTVREMWALKARVQLRGTDGSRCLWENSLSGAHVPLRSSSGLHNRFPDDEINNWIRDTPRDIDIQKLVTRSAQHTRTFPA